MRLLEWRFDGPELRGSALKLDFAISLPPHRQILLLPGVRELVTPHGAVDLPAFMPVGTRGTVKGLTADMVRGTGPRWSSATRTT